MKQLIGILLAFAAMSSAQAQTVVSGSVADEAGEALAGSTVLFIQADTVAGGTVTDSKGRFELKDLPQGEYECRASRLGYKPASQKFKLVEKAKLPKFSLEEDATMLGEVTVTGDARERTKELAGMSIYYLTDRAKKEPNAYMALREIPRLRVNEATRSISLDNGTAPLILVNGVRKPLNTLDPALIESVEVIDNPSARYRGDATVASVLNIKMKREGIKPYLRGEIGAQSMLNANTFFTSGSFEMGNSTTSLYFNPQYSQIRNTQINTYSEITQGEIHRLLNDEKNGYWRSLSFSLGGDKVISKKDYLAFNLNYLNNPSGGNTTAKGEITDLATVETLPLTSFTDTKERLRQFAGNLYYKHNFKGSRILEITGNYYYSLNGNTTDREENSKLYSYVSHIDLDNSRHLGQLNANYSDYLTGTMHLDAGSNTEYSVTNIDDRLDSWPNFRYRRTREYLYAGVDNNWSQSKFNYMVSLGLDMVFSDADGVRNSYVDFIPSISLAYKITTVHGINLSYNRSRMMPSAGNLNPRNTSTDVLIVNEGNPLLKPSHADKVKLGYVFSKGAVRFDPYIEYTYNSDLIMPYQYMDGNISVNTYQNFGHSEQLRIGGSLSYNFPRKNGFYGNSSVFAYYQKDYIKGMAFRGSSYVAMLNGYLGYNNFSLSMNFGLIGPGYSLYSKNLWDLSGNAFFNWSVSNSVNISLSAQNIFWRRHKKTWTVNGDYNSYSSTVYKSLAPKIEIGVWYTFVTKNFKWRQKKKFYGGDGELQTVKTN